MEPERLQKFLARAGVASRRAAEGLISAGRVKVNNLVVTELGTKVTAGRDLVTVDGKPIDAQVRAAWYVLYKPPQVLTTLDDPRGRPTVKEYLGRVQERVWPVGRLDWDAEGALLLTNDGETANRLLHPRYGVSRTYLAKVKGDPDPESLIKLERGVRLEDGPAKALSVRVFQAADKNTWLELVVGEGRPHLVKRLCAAIGHPVQRLFRPAQAGVGVEGLRPGQLRPLTADEVRSVKAIAGGAPAPPVALRLPARRHGRAEQGDEDAEEAAPRRPRPPQKRPRPGQRR